MCDVYQLPRLALYLLQPDQNFLMKVKVEDLEKVEDLLTQKHGMIVIKVKVEDSEDLVGSSNIQEYMPLLCYTLQIGYKRS